MSFFKLKRLQKFFKLASSTDTLKSPTTKKLSYFEENKSKFQLRDSI